MLHRRRRQKGGYTRKNRCNATPRSRPRLHPPGCHRSRETTVPRGRRCHCGKPRALHRPFSTTVFIERDETRAVHVVPADAVDLDERLVRIVRRALSASWKSGGDVDLRSFRKPRFWRAPDACVSAFPCWRHSSLNGSFERRCLASDTRTGSREETRPIKSLSSRF